MVKRFKQGNLLFTHEFSVNISDSQRRLLGKDVDMWFDVRMHFIDAEGDLARHLDKSDQLLIYYVYPRISISGRIRKEKRLHSGVLLYDTNEPNLEKQYADIQRAIDVKFGVWAERYKYREKEKRKNLLRK